MKVKIKSRKYPELFVILCEACRQYCDHLNSATEFETALTFVKDGCEICNGNLSEETMN